MWGGLSIGAVVFCTSSCFERSLWKHCSAMALRHWNKKYCKHCYSFWGLVGWNTLSGTRVQSRPTLCTPTPIREAFPNALLGVEIWVREMWKWLSLSSFETLHLSLTAVSGGCAFTQAGDLSRSSQKKVTRAKESRQLPLPPGGQGFHPPHHPQHALFISHLTTWLRTRRFSEPTFRPSPEPKIIGKTQWFATFLPFRAPASSFFALFLFSDLLSSALLLSDSSHLCFSLSILSDVWLLNFLRICIKERVSSSREAQRNRLHGLDPPGRCLPIAFAFSDLILRSKKFRIMMPRLSIRLADTLPNKIQSLETKLPLARRRSNSFKAQKTPKDTTITTTMYRSNIPNA